MREYRHLSIIKKLESREIAFLREFLRRPAYDQGQILSLEKQEWM
jgi:hypothetical protein